MVTCEGVIVGVPKAELTVRDVAVVDVTPMLSVTVMPKEYEPVVADETVQVVLVEVHPLEIVTPDGTFQV